MKTSIEFELEPFTVPDFVNTKHSNSSKMDSICIPLKTLSTEALEELCTEFRIAVFRKAQNNVWHTQ